MARSIQTIEKDLAALETILETLAQDFYNAYRDYLTVLGRSARQQFILASYQLCTQGFPEAFLGLSLTQRQDLQSAVRKLGETVQRQLTDLINLPCPSVFSQDSTKALAAPDPLHASDALSEEVATPPDLDSEESFSSEELGEAIASEAPSRPIALPLTPRTLSQWQERIEEAIGEALKEISHAANCCFQEAGLLSQALPDALLEIASKADMIAENSTSAPNLLQLRVETEGEPIAEGAAGQITVIHLRLSEIEFANPELMPWRTKIRDLSTRLAQLQREYRRKNHEKAIAEAEAAWRSSWFEE